MTNYETAYRRTFTAWSKGKYSLALERSRELVREFPNYDFGCLLRGIILYEVSRHQEAEVVLRQAIRVLPRECRHYGYLQLGDLHEHRGDFEKANKWYRMALKLNPAYTRGHIALGKLLARKGELRRTEASFRKAVRCAKGTLAEAHLNLGYALRAQQRYSEALRYFKRALETKPDYREAIAAKTDVENAMAVASGLSKRSGKLQKDMERGWREIARANDKDLFCHTTELAGQFLADFPDFHVAWLWYGRSLYNIGRYPEAVRALQRALHLFGKDRRHLVLAEFGHLYRRKGDFRQAEFWYRKGLAARSPRASCHIYLGALLAEAGRFRAAEAMHRKATHREQGCPDEAYLNLGLVLRAQERYKEALGCFQKALALDPHYRQAKEAIADVKQALQLRIQNARRARR